jgi:hypothetical protein
MAYAHMGVAIRKRMAIGLEDFAHHDWKRLRSLATAPGVAGGAGPGAEIDVKVVLDCFDIWCPNALCDEVTTMFDGRSLDDIWTQFRLSYARPGGGSSRGR